MRGRGWGAGPEGPPRSWKRAGASLGRPGCGPQAGSRASPFPVWATVRLPRLASGTTPWEGGRHPQAWSPLLSWAALGLAGDLSAPRSRGVSQGDKPCGGCRAVSPVSERAPGVGARCGEPAGFRLAPSPAPSHLLQTEQPLEKTLYERSAKENYMAVMSPPGCPQYLPRSPRIGTRSSTRGTWGTAGIFQKAPRRLARC